MAEKPLVPVGVDLRDFAFMPVDIVRLFSSEFHAQANDAEWRAGFTLWLKSYHQVPASSLPNDDVALARLAELGRDLKEWRKIKAGALRGWTLCSDGRLYHRVVAEKALEGWLEKLAQRKSSAAGNAKRYGTSFDPLPFDEQMEESRRCLATLNPQSRVLAKRGGKPPVGSPDASPDGSADGSPVRCPAGTPDQPPDDLPSGSQGTGTGKGQGSEERNARERASLFDQPKAGKPPRRNPFPPDAFDRWYEQYPHKVGRGAAEKAFAKAQGADGVDFDALLDAVGRYRRSKPSEQPWCNPSTWLNQKRWLDEPALPSGDQLRPAGASGSPSVDLGGGIVAPHETIRSVWSSDRWPNDWGPRPDEPGCLISSELMATIMQGRKVA